VRLAVTGDWVFFLDNEDWFSTWARRWGDSAVQALAKELRLTNWRTARSVNPGSDSNEIPTAREDRRYDRSVAHGVFAWLHSQRMTPACVV
jgi:hypothetical protein